MNAVNAHAHRPCGGDRPISGTVSEDSGDNGDTNERGTIHNLALRKNVEVT